MIKIGVCDLEDRTLMIGGKYRHFKNKLYTVLCVASHSETMEKLVVYKAEYGDGEIYARPIDMFLAPVDREKYPDVKQHYRFEHIEE